MFLQLDVEFWNVLRMCNRCNKQGPELLDGLRSKVGRVAQSV